MLFLHKKWQDILKITTKRTGWRELAHMVLLEMLGFREVYKKNYTTIHSKLCNNHVKPNGNIYWYLSKVSD